MGFDLNYPYAETLDRLDLNIPCVENVDGDDDEFRSAVYGQNEEDECFAERGNDGSADEADCSSCSNADYIPNDEGFQSGSACNATFTDIEDFEGVDFPSASDAYKAYYMFAHSRGFSVRIQYEKGKLGDKTLIRVYTMDQALKDCPRFSRSSSSNSDVFEPISSNSAMQRASLVGWLNGILPDLRLPLNASDEELQSSFADGSVLCRLLNKLKPGCVTESGGSTDNSQSCPENVQRFLSAMEKMGLMRLHTSDLEKGSMKPVLDCLLALQTHFMILGRNNVLDASSRWKFSGEAIGNVNGLSREEFFRSPSSTPFGGDKWKLLSDSKFDRIVGPRMTMTGVNLF